MIYPNLLLRDYTVHNTNTSVLCLLQSSSKSKPSSIVGTVKRKFVDEEEVEEEEYDPLNPAVNTVASVIRGPCRK